jgi:hypothetical protein
MASPRPKSCDTMLARRKQADFQGRLKLSSTDWLRLDVAYAGGSEIYSWAGASKFEEGELDQLVPEGATGTGPFAAMLLAIFEPRFPKYSFEGARPRVRSGPAAWTPRRCGWEFSPHAPEPGRAGASRLRRGLR